MSTEAPDVPEAPAGPVVTSDAGGLSAAPGADVPVSEYFKQWWIGVKAGDLGSLPIFVGLILIAIVFQSQNDHFLTPGNFVNLIVQMAPVAIIGMGVVFVLLLGEIDLSVGFVSGVAGVTVALLTVPDGSQIAAGPAIFIGLAAGLAIGTFHGLLITKIGIPSFIVTLAGLLAWNGVVLLLIGSRGTVTIQSNLLIGFANDFLPEAASWVVLFVGIAFFVGSMLWAKRTRDKAGLPSPPTLILGLRAAAVTVVGVLFVYFANEDRGIPYVFLIIGGTYIIWTYVLTHTTFGRHIYAVGGSAEAARRAGINVDNIKIACFALCSMMAALGGLVLASRLRSVDTNAGGGSILLYSIAAAVIGGTSLFGGRGHMKSAVLGALVIASIDNGLGLLGLGSGEKFVITGGVLLLAVSVDSITRRNREASGRA
jgi:D-xylose transport system permease protein